MKMQGVLLGNPTLPTDGSRPGTTLVTMVNQSLAEQGGTYGVQYTLVYETVFMTKTRMGDTTDMADQRAVLMPFAITSMRLPIHQSTRYVLRLFSEAYTHFAVTIGTAGSAFKTPHIDPTDISMMTNTDMKIYVASTTEHGVQKTTIKYAKHDASSAIRNRFEVVMVTFPHTRLLSKPP
ncbi:hypothetical protein PC116_g13033 [Phytophthora cactorum]|uniref:Uncharacterized protein n=2 Tax=Phytophthora cactorum TaxID=29920 RepID=A0A8T1APL0_9STRA|nr:hypothetical protein Pcac1_g25189 [Phytophthora cactorum]KAG2875821.1 hypothetical protein PC114_g24512 [Phytophthora cactorum]KAG2887203.1 hypothetical protein PC117_g25224 [Phytophthora cactorum]KAG2963815.1 hypothetical protein PC119_g25408 [Phytophthora cactorum]KAG3135874.1 hypothetical protein C6341_g21604 [Phytophthora cactorum]